MTAPQATADHDAPECEYAHDHRPVHAQERYRRAWTLMGYGEHQCDAARYRKITELCLAAGVDQTLIKAWIEVGRQRVGTAATLTYKTLRPGRVSRAIASEISRPAGHQHGQPHIAL